MKSQLIFDFFEMHVFYTEIVVRNNTCIGGIVNKVQRGGGEVNKILKIAKESKKSLNYIFVPFFRSLWRNLKNHMADSTPRIHIHKITSFFKYV